MKTFDTYFPGGVIHTGMRPCMKKPIIIQAVQINEEFRVNSLEGNYVWGKVGDYLMQGVDDEHYICDKDIFEKSYDWTSNKSIKPLHPSTYLQAGLDDLKEAKELYTKK